VSGLQVRRPKENVWLYMPYDFARASSTSPTVRSAETVNACSLQVATAEGTRSVGHVLQCYIGMSLRLQRPARSLRRIAYRKIYEVRECTWRSLSCYPN
jgi:hypothetical protein